MDFCGPQRITGNPSDAWISTSFRGANKTFASQTISEVLVAAQGIDEFPKIPWSVSRRLTKTKIKKPFCFWPVIFVATGILLLREDIDLCGGHPS